MEARMCWEFYHGLADISILSRAMIHFDSDMSKSTNTVVYFDWKTVIYIYVCRKCRTQFILPMEKSVNSPAHVVMRFYRMDNSLVC